MLGCEYNRDVSSNFTPSHPSMPTNTINVEDEVSFQGRYTKYLNKYK